MELSIQAELQDLNACAQGNWEATLASIRQRLPPVGSGQCPRSLFIRLFQGARQRIARQDALAKLCERLQRAELQQVLAGLQLLMESDLPDDEPVSRDVLFGHGYSAQHLQQSVAEEFRT